MSVKVQINVVNQLKLLRQSTFKDRLAFIDENVQNAQRAKATEIKIHTDWMRKTVTFLNNGAVLDDFQKLFSIAESGWDDDTVKNENPFGMGFFSNISVSDKIMVHSGNQVATLDINAMIHRNELDIEVSHTDNFVDGFELILYNFDFSDIRESEIEERCALLGAYVHTLDVICNDVVMERKTLTQTDGSPYSISVEEDSFIGWIALSTSFISGLNIFYKGRLVKTLEMYYVKGDLHISDKALNLTAPDRKDIIKDYKLDAFTQTVKMYVEEVAEMAAISTLKNKEKYIDAVNWYVSATRIASKMTFMMFRVTDDRQAEVLSKIVKAKSEKKPLDKAINELYIKNTVQGESHFDTVEESKIIEEAPASKTGYSGGSTGGYYNRSELNDDNNREEEQGEDILNSDRPKFWVGYDEILEHETKINLIKRYDLILIVSRNSFENKALRGLTELKQVYHISSLSNKIVVTTTLSNTVLDLKEQRALMLLDMISRIAGFEHNKFAIGDLMVTRTLSIPEIDVHEEQIEADIVAIVNDNVDKVYIDRSIINKHNLIESTEPKLCMSDYRFIMANLLNFVEQLSILGKHNKISIMETILNTLGE